MHRRRRHVDALGVATLLGALLGFIAGAAVGMSSPDLTTPVLAPFVGAVAGIVAGALLVLVPSLLLWRRDRRARELGHEHIRAEAHVDWPEGIDLAADPPPRPSRPDRFNVEV